MAIGVLIWDDREWDMTPDGVNASQAGNVFMIGVGGVFGLFPLPPFLFALPSAIQNPCYLEEGRLTQVRASRHSLGLLRPPARHLLVPDPRPRHRRLVRGGHYL